ncbi:MAG: hypothetical protein AB7L66_09100 [Gemmatimonadales bacterium]
MTTLTRMGVFGILAAGCGNYVDLPAAEPLPLVEAVLIGGATEPEFRIEWLTPGEDSRPATPAETTLELVGPTGAPVALRPTGVPGRFSASLSAPIEAGGRYRLQGTVAGQSLVAETTLPASFRVVVPADTLFATDPIDDLAEAEFRAEAVGATIFIADSAAFGPGGFATRQAVDTLRIPPPSTGRTITRLRVQALNRDGDRYLYAGDRAATNVAGGFGVLAGALERTLVVIWQ